MIPPNTSLKIDFNDWLAACPLQWHRERFEDGEVTYTFFFPDEEEDEDD